MGIQPHDIAAIMGISKTALERHHKHDLDLGNAKISERMMDVLLDLCQSEKDEVRLKAATYFLDRRSRAFRIKQAEAPVDAAGEVIPNKFVIEFVKPASQVAAHKLGYSPADKKTDDADQDTQPQ